MVAVIDVAAALVNVEIAQRRPSHEEAAGAAGPVDGVHLLREVTLDVLHHRPPAFGVDLGTRLFELRIQTRVAGEVALAGEVEAPEAGRSALAVVLLGQL